MGLYDPEDEHPMEMFSTPHLIALAITIVIYALLFFTRKFFVKYKIADIIFRFSLASLLIGFEMWLTFRGGPVAIFGHILGSTYPLCGHLIWFTSIALYSDSVRLMKIIYPLTILGGTLSMIVLDTNTSFPHICAIQFWTIHSGFILGSLYFVFTGKINKYTLNDLGYTLLALFLASLYIFLVGSGRLHCDPKFTDPFFLISPPGGLEFFKDALGQFLYTVLYIALVILFQFGVYGLTYLGTRKREDNLEKNPVAENAFVELLAKGSPFIRRLSLIIIYGIGLYFSVLYRVTRQIALLYFDDIFFFTFFICVVLNEVTDKYLEDRSENHEENQDIKEESESIAVEL